MKLWTVAVLCHLALLDGALCTQPGGRNNVVSARLNTTSPQHHTVAATMLYDIKPTKVAKSTRSSKPVKKGRPDKANPPIKKPTTVTSMRPSRSRSAANSPKSLPGAHETPNGGSSTRPGPKSDARSDRSQVKVKPSLIKCICNGDEKDPFCCSAIRMAGSKMEPTTKPIVVPVPETTTVSGEKTTTTVTQDVWKTITDTKYFTQHQGQVCTSTVIASNTQMMCKAGKVMSTSVGFPGRTHGEVRPQQPHGDDRGRPINRPGKFYVPDACPPGYSCQPDFGYCHDKCGDYFKGCWGEQCKADFLRCYDDCFLRHDAADDQTHREPTHNHHHCRVECKASDWRCLRQCSKSNRVASRDTSLAQYPHDDAVMTIESCHQACPKGPENRKCYDRCKEYRPSKFSQHRQSGCARGYSCRKGGDKS